MLAVAFIEFLPIAFIVLLPLSMLVAVVFKRQLPPEFIKRHPRSSYWLCVFGIDGILIGLLVYWFISSWHKFTF